MAACDGGRDLCPVRAGSDLAAGERALAAGTFLGPAQLGLLAGLGIADVTVYKALTVLLVTTGDEVVEPGQALPAGKIYNSNGTLLESAMRQAGLNVVRTRIATDRPGELRALLQQPRRRGGPDRHHRRSQQGRL